MKVTSFLGHVIVQSLKPKELQVSDLVNDYSLDFLLLTEKHGLMISTSNGKIVLS